MILIRWISASSSLSSAHILSKVNILDFWHDTTSSEIIVVKIITYTVDYIDKTVRPSNQRVLQNCERFLELHNSDWCFKLLFVAVFFIWWRLRRQRIVRFIIRRLNLQPQRDVVLTISAGPILILQSADDSSARGGSKVGSASWSFFDLIRRCGDNSTQPEQFFSLSGPCRLDPGRHSILWCVVYSC